MKCYVYLLTVDGVARYVGKGTGQRLHSHLKKAQSILRRRQAGEGIRTTHFYNRLVKALRNGAEISASILVDGLTDDEAFAREIIEIASREGLWNKYPGGNGTTSDQLKKVWHSHPELKARHAAAMAVVLADPVVRQRLSETSKARWADSEFHLKTAEAIRAKISTKENKTRASEHAKRIWSDPATRANIMAGLERDQQREEYRQNKVKAGKAGSREDKSRAGKLGSVNRSAQMLAVWASSKRKRAASKRAADRSGRLRAAWAKRTAELDNAVLALCQRDTGASPKEIWAAFGRQQNIIRKLLERGLIERRGDYHDGRYHSLTPQPT